MNPSIFYAILTTNYVTLSIPFFLLAIAVEALICKRRQLPYYRLNDGINSLSCGILQQLGEIGLAGIMLLPFGYIQEHWGLIEFSTLTGAPLIFSAVMLFLGVDLGYYWFHRLAHGTNIGWAVHVVHHQSEEYNYTTALRQGMFQVFFSFFFYLPLAFIGFPLTWYMGLMSANTAYQFWVHTRVIHKLPPWFEAVFNTPSHHRVHHGQNPEYLDRNHAGVLIIWDKLFGTFQPEHSPPVYGITTPLHSWDPLWAQVHYFAELLRLTRLAPRWQDKLHLWFQRPGWIPRGIPRPTPKPAPQVIYNPPYPLLKGVLATVIFSLAIAGSVVVILTDVLTGLAKGGLMLGIIVALTISGRMLSGYQPLRIRKAHSGQ